MLRWTEEMTCSMCGRKFLYEFGDAVRPWDAEIMERPVCRRCRLKENLHVDLNYRSDMCHHILQGRSPKHGKDR